MWALLHLISAIYRWALGTCLCVKHVSYIEHVSYIMSYHVYTCHIISHLSFHVYVSHTLSRMSYHICMSCHVSASHICYVTHACLIICWPHVMPLWHTCHAMSYVTMSYHICHTCRVMSYVTTSYQMWQHHMWPDLGKPTILSQLTFREIPI